MIFVANIIYYLLLMTIKKVYEGGKWVRMYRDIDSIPVLAPEGTILPMYKNDRMNNISLDQPLEIHLWRGNGSFELYEDDGESMDYKKGRSAKTLFELQEHNGILRLTITPPKDGVGLLPDEREMYIKFRDIDAEDVRVVLSTEPVAVELQDIKPRKRESLEEMKSAILTRVQGSNDRKSAEFGIKYPPYVSDCLDELDALV